MEFFRVYGRVIGLLRDERWLAVGLALANVAVAALQFYEPVLFGKVVDLLSNAKSESTEALWSNTRDLLLLWAKTRLPALFANLRVWKASSYCPLLLDLPGRRGRRRFGVCEFQARIPPAGA